MIRRLATFTEANAWVHLPPEWFTCHFPSIRSVWQAEGGQVWVEAEDQPAFVLWEMAEQRTGDPVLPVAAGFKCAFGHPHQARLDPPSADPRGCHSRR